MRRLTAILAVVLLAGCGFHVASRPSREGAPLYARLFADGASDPFYTFFLSRPAHVALFDVRPGRSVEMVYPWHEGADTWMYAGYRAVHPSPFNTGFQHVGSGVREPGVGYLVLIASDRPLDLGSVEESVSMGGMPVVPDRRFLRGSAFAVIDRLATRLVGQTPARGSAVDYVAYWRSPPPPSFAARKRFASRARWGAGLAADPLRDRFRGVVPAVTARPRYLPAVSAASEEPPAARREPPAAVHAPPVAPDEPARLAPPADRHAPEPAIEVPARTEPRPSAPSSSSRRSEPQPGRTVEPRIPPAIGARGDGASNAVPIEAPQLR